VGRTVGKTREEQKASVMGPLGQGANAPDGEVRAASLAVKRSADWLVLPREDGLPRDSRKNRKRASWGICLSVPSETPPAEVCTSPMPTPLCCPCERDQGHVLYETGQAPGGH
jgi:hypothetical protein